ncbi:acyl-CoA dehydrogenase family protein [Amycolatopsis sp.]|uniref:acyl-CoA dehydrogenase family protein n=1 Tax=Amycolatopsis sp. TaxID=37632 RepID=UPI002DFEBA42|nr:acyl-CoA dehydrogenase family protein [Amycolatopsis sp.]
MSIGLTASTILSKGTLEQKQRWLPGLATFEKIGAWAITEPDSGSDAFGGMKSYVRRDGDDYVLNGQKTFITNGPCADTIVVYAKLDEGDGVDRRERKVLTFVLDSGMAGLTQSKPVKKMGMNSSPTGELFFDNVRLGPDRLLGEQSDGKDSARESFSYERMGVAALSLGIINECHRLCVDYAKNRTLWGQEIGRFQLIQLKLAKMEVAPRWRWKPCSCSVATVTWPNTASSSWRGTPSR